MHSRSGNPFGHEPRVLTRPWRLLRATALSSALIWVYLTAPAHRPVGGLIGAGLGYAALTLLLDREPGSVWPRLRLLLDLGLAGALAAVDGPGLSSPLRYLFVLPILEASLTLGLEELLGSALLVLVAATGLALRSPGETSREDLMALAGGVLTATMFLALLARDARARSDHEARLQRLLRQQQALSVIAATTRREQSFEDLAATILETVLSLTGAHAATLALLNDAGDALEPVGSVTRGPEPPVNRIVRVGRDELGEPGEPPPVAVARAMDGPGALAQVPLVGDGERTIGRLTLRSPLPVQAFGPDDREALAALGAQAGAAWETAWLRHSLSRQSEDLNRSAGELSALVEASRALVSLDQHDVLDEILGRAIGLVAAERGSLMLLDEHGQELRIETARGLPGSIVENTRQKVGEGFAGKVAATGKPLRLTDTLEPGIVRAGVKDAMCVPLRIQDHIIGVLNISNKTGPEQFTDRDMDVLSALANQAAIAIQNARLFGDLQELLLSTISTLAKAVDAKDRYTAGHSHRVTLYSLEIGRELGLGAAELDLLRIGALMHDVGKIGVPEQILRKPGPLTEPEREEMRRHPLYGARIVEPIRQLHPILPAVRWHHERYDGGGYPDGLVGDEIPTMARILMVADAYDAMTSDRPYRRSLSDEVALQELREGVRLQWHADAVDAFLRAHQAGKIEPIKGAMPEA